MLGWAIKRINQGDWERAYTYFHDAATDYAPQYADWWFQAGYAAYQQGSVRRTP
jgi:hypothetical protein